jgi:hypothetical protein
MKVADLIAVLLEVLRGRVGKWDVIKDAISSTGQTVRLIAIIVTMAISTGLTVFLVDLLVHRR